MYCILEKYGTSRNVQKEFHVSPTHLSQLKRPMRDPVSQRGVCDFFFLIEVRTFNILFVLGALPLFDCELFGLGGNSEFALRSDESSGDFRSCIDSGNSSSYDGGPANVFWSSSTALSKLVPRIRTILIFSIVT